MEFLTRYRAQLDQTLCAMDLKPVQEVIAWLKETRDSGRTIFTCGNGGSASTASHFVCDLAKGASWQRTKRYRAIALTDASPTISAYSNDVGYDSIFAEQLKNMAAAGDLVIAISGSGNSPNVLEAVKYARAAGCRTVGMTGRDGGKLAGLVDKKIHVPVQHMGIIEDMHLILCHMMGYCLMEQKD
jgi:D-sedoheptulose 7-phosphate isomerase